MMKTWGKFALLRFGNSLATLVELRPRFGNGFSDVHSPQPHFGNVAPFDQFDGVEIIPSHLDLLEWKVWHGWDFWVWRDVARRRRFG